MKTIKEVNFENKTIILRCDLNVTIKDGKIISDEKIKASLKTINYLVDHNAKIIIMSHLGKIKEVVDKENNTLYPVYLKLKELLNTNIYFSFTTKGLELESMINRLQNREILLMENTRYEDLNNNAESKCDEELSKYWASLGNIFVNDAFGLTHRKHASNYGISQYLPTYIGFLIEDELKGLNQLFNVKHPYTVIMSGAKLKDKIAIINKILPQCDYLLLGGGIANTFLSLENNIGKSITSEESILEVKELLSLYKDKIVLPIDVLVENNNQITNKQINEIQPNDTIYDIGDGTIELYKNFIEKSQTIFLNGTVGKYEDERFTKGTKEILRLVSNNTNTTIIGGGDAISSSDKFNINNFTFKSTGGGATLEYLANGKINCFDE